MNNEYAKKPPLGATPAWLGAARRISELAKAINRTAVDYSDGYEYRMKNWAKEIMMQCDILSDFPPGSEPKVPIPAMLFHAFNSKMTMDKNRNELEQTIHEAGKAHEQRFQNNTEDGDTLA